MLPFGCERAPTLTLAAGFAQRTAVAVAYCKRGKGSIKLNGCPIELIEPEVLRHKVRRRPNPPFLASRRRTERKGGRCGECTGGGTGLAGHCRATARCGTTGSARFH